jgi:hypothetical protein
MKAFAAMLALVLILAFAAPVGSQEGPVVRPRVVVHTGAAQPNEPPPEIQSFGTTLVLSFWIAEGEKQTLKAGIRCATPDYRAALTKQSGDFTVHLEVEGVIQILRDGEILLLYEAQVASGAHTDRTLAEIKGSVIMREGKEKVLLKTDESSLCASFAFDEDK